MIFLIRLVLKTFVQLFPRGVHRNRAILLATVATIVPLSQLFVIRIFSQMILDGPSAEVAAVALNFALFFGLFGLSHLATFWQKTHRVKVFNDALKSREGKRTRMTESWEFALAFETNNLLHTFTQVAVLSTFFIVVNWESGLFRMQNSNLTQTSGSLMRFARAKALSEAPEKYRQVKLDEDELG